MAKFVMTVYALLTQFK